MRSMAGIGPINTKLRILAIVVMSLLSPLLGGQADAQTAGAGTYDYCSVMPNRRTIIFLVDRSATYTEKDVALLERGWQIFGTSISTPGDRLIIRTVGDYATTSIKLFDDCLPGCPPDSYFKWYDACNKGAVSADIIRFVNRIGQSLNPTMLQRSESRKVETALADTIMLAVRDTRPALLVIFSDFLEYHADGKETVDFYQADWKSMMSFLANIKRRRALPDLSGTQVIGYGFGSELGPPSQAAKNLNAKTWTNVYKWWVQYFSEAQAGSVSIETEYLGMTAPPPPPEAGPELRLPTSPRTTPDKR